MKRISFKNNQGLTLKGVLHSPNDSSRKVVIVLHGYMDSKERGQKAISELLEENSINSFRFDLSAHGESEGDLKDATISNWVEDLECAIKTMVMFNYTTIELVAHSLGGVIALETLLKHKSINKLCLRAPNPDPYSIWNKRLGVEKLKEIIKQGEFEYTSKEGVVFKLHKALIEDSVHHQILDQLKELQAKTLVIHGDNDQLVNIESSKDLVERLPNAKLEIIEGANHWLGVDKDFSLGNSKILQFFQEE